MKQLFIHRSAIENGNGVTRGFIRNLYFIQNSLGFSIILMSEPRNELANMLRTEGIQYKMLSREITQSSDDILITANEIVAFPGLSLNFSNNWDEMYALLSQHIRCGEITRTTKETDIKVKVALNGSGKTQIDTGLGFFDHMLDQIGKHSGCDLEILVKGDLEVDEHHTIEDTAIALGEAFTQALGDKKGLSRYGFFLPMDESVCWVALDFGGRPWLNWVAEFNREYVGDMPTEMFMHFFKSFSDAARCNLYIKAEGDNEHHKIEGIFKAFARSIGMAIKQEPYSLDIPTTKGLL